MAAARRGAALVLLVVCSVAVARVLETNRAAEAGAEADGSPDVERAAEPGGGASDVDRDAQEDTADAEPDTNRAANAIEEPDAKPRANADREANEEREGNLDKEADAEGEADPKQALRHGDPHGEAGVDEEAESAKAKALRYYPMPPDWTSSTRCTTGRDSPEESECRHPSDNEYVAANTEGAGDEATTEAATEEPETPHTPTEKSKELLEEEEVPEEPQPEPTEGTAEEPETTTTTTVWTTPEYHGPQAFNPDFYLDDTK